MTFESIIGIYPTSVTGFIRSRRPVNIWEFIVKRLTLGIAVVALLSQCAAGAALPSKSIIDVRVEGNQRLSRNAVLSYVKTRVGAVYDDQTVKADRDRLMGSARFKAVVATREYTDKGVIVTFKVTERPTIAKLEIVGNKKFKTEELLKDMPIGEGDPMNKAAIEGGKGAIVNKYREEGYHIIKVTVDKETLQNKSELIYNIVEGPQTIIKKVRFEGNRYFSNFSLTMKTSTKARLWPFIDGALNVEKVERDVTLMRNVYVQDGFLDAEVGRTLDFSADKTNVTVKFIIKEGPRYRINEILFKGNTVFSPEELRLRLNFHQGSFFTTDVLRVDKKKVDAAYGEIGYLEAQVQVNKRFLNPNAPVPQWAVDIDGGKPALINLVFAITEKDQYRIGQIKIQGNSITQSRVIRREFRFFPEQLYDTVSIEISKNRLKELRLFEEVTITPVGTQQKAVKDIVVEVKEGRTGDFMVGVGASSNSGLFGTISLTQRNFDIFAWPSSWKNLLKPQTFKGAGQVFNIKAEPGMEYMSFSTSWFTPYIFDLPYSLGMKAFLFNRGYSHYEETRLGIQTSFGHRFKNRWYGELATRLEHIDLSVSQRAAREIWKDRGTHTLLGLRGSLTRDRTDSRWMPTTGDRFQFSYEQIVGSEVFGKFGADYRIYRTVYQDALDRKHILAGRMSFGQLVGDAPIFEKFYAGGLGSIRGFRFHGVSPRGRNRIGGGFNNDPIGGDMMFLAGVEYSFPIITDKLRGVVFLDTGTVEGDFGFTSYRAAAGFGVRWAIPFFGDVPMALDFGFPLAKDDEDDTQIFSFSLGWTF